VGWYAVGEQPITSIRSLSHLRDALGSARKETDSGQKVVVTVRQSFDQAMAPIREQGAKLLQGQGRSRAEALAEEIRDLLLQAAYVELVKAGVDGMFARDGGAGFSVETVRRLRRHKFPFAGALRAVAVEGLTLSRADPKYVKLTQTRPDQLARRFEAIRNRIAELLPRYIVAAESAATTSSAPIDGQEIQVVLYRPS
jgi:hypothetical protein